jgi:hypothetical protein
MSDVHKISVSISSPTSLQGGQAKIRYTGALANTTNLRIHYGFNGWNYVSDIDLQDEDDGGNVNYFAEKAMDKSDGLEFETTIDISLEARVLHFVFYSDDQDGRRWDNNDGSDYRASIGTLYAGPYLTWNENVRPHDGVVVNFITDHPLNARVEFGTEPALGSVAESNATTNHHHIELRDLQGNTVYHYRVFNGSRPLSSVHTFKTASLDTSQYSFIVVGDMQDNGDNRCWGDVATEILGNHSDIDFLVLVGDLTWNDTPGHWWVFFDKARDLFANKVIMPIVGNHDTPGTGSNADARTFQRIFRLPTTEDTPTYYPFWFGTARFLALNSEIPKDFEEDSGKQFKWARDKLEAISDDAGAAWVFVNLHIPPYNAGRRHLHGQGLFRNITRLFDGRVDWVFSGHEHLYQRFKPLKYNASFASSGEYGTQRDRGVGYLIVPPAGNLPESKLVASGSRVSRYRGRLAYPEVTSESSLVKSEIGFVRVVIDGMTIDLKTYGMGTLESPVQSNVIDHVTYRK